MEKLGIISGCDYDRTLASANHEYYAKHQDLCYIYDTAPAEHPHHFYKLDKIAKFLKHNLFEYIFWLDDDAFFMQPDKNLTSFIDGNSDSDLIFCKSPINRDKDGNEIWTYLSSGNFFIRNTPLTRQFFAACYDVSLETVKKWWDPEKYGFFTNGDQDVMVYLLHQDERFNHPRFHTLLPYEAFNTRPFHFKEKADEHFLVHFTGPNKHQQAVEFGEKFGLSAALIPEQEFVKMHGVRYPAR